MHSFRCSSGYRDTKGADRLPRHLYTLWMPEITFVGWIHTGVAIIAIAAGFYSLARHKLILPANRSGQIYLAGTLITAVTALMIYQRGTFGPGHSLAVLTLLALAAGFLVMKIPALSKFAKYFQALCFSATLLFHMIPAITDGLLRLPVGDPVLTDIRDPLLAKFYLAFLITFVIGYLFQVSWLRGQQAP